MATENKSAQPNDALEERLGFRIEVRPGGEAGSVVWFKEARHGTSNVRPATGVEIMLWQALQASITLTRPGGVAAERVIDPFGTPKS